MRIAIASEGKTQEFQISERGGRAPYYLIFENKNLIEVIKNPFAKGSGGAGFSVAFMLADKKVNLVIAGRIGENMISALKQRGIDFKTYSGIIKEFLKKFNY